MLTFVFAGKFLQAQQPLYGQLKSMSGQPIAGASILLYKIKTEGNNSLAAFATTDAQGQWTIQLPAVPGNFLLAATALGFQRFEKSFRLPLSDTSDRFWTKISLTETVHFLDTVRVSSRIAIEIKGDTIRFDPERFALKNEQNLEQLLARLPGMQVGSDGRLTFQGQLIGSVLIEGDNLFGSRYDLLTQNAPAEMVEKIEVLKNFQPDSLLRKMSVTEGTALNLKLKSKYKNKLMGYAALSGGAPQAAGADIFGMLLNPKLKMQGGFQYNSLGKVYTMQDPLQQLVQLIQQPQPKFIAYSPLPAALSSSHYLSQDLPAQYQLLNAGGQAYANALWKNRRGWQFTFHGVHARDTLLQQQLIEQRFADGNQLSFNNRRSEALQMQHYQLQAQKSSARSSTYLSVNYQCQERRPLLEASINRLPLSAQRLQQQDHVLGLDANHNRLLGRQFLLVTKYSFRLQTLPEQMLQAAEQLFWLPQPPPAFFELRSHLRRQQIQHQLISGGRWQKGKWTFGGELKWLHRHYQRQTDLTALDRRADSGFLAFTNAVNLVQMQAQINTNIRYKLAKQWRLEASLEAGAAFVRPHQSTPPIANTQFWPYTAAVGIGKEHRGRNYQLQLEASRQISDLNQVYQQPVLSGQRQLNIGLPAPFASQHFGINFTHTALRLKRQRFSLAFLRAGWVEEPFVATLSSSAQGIVMGFAPLPNRTWRIMNNYRAEQTLGNTGLTGTASLAATYLTRYQLFNGVLQQTANQLWSGELLLRSQWKGWFNLKHESQARFTHNRLMRPEGWTNELWQMKHQTHLYAVWNPGWNATITHHWIQWLSPPAQQFRFLDVLMSRSLGGRYKWLLELQARNLLNLDQWNMIAVSPLLVETQQLQLRGRQVFVRVKCSLP